jgi:hypothetical protein
MLCIRARPHGMQKTMFCNRARLQSCRKCLIINVGFSPCGLLFRRQAGVSTPAQTHPYESQDRLRGQAAFKPSSPKVCKYELIVTPAVGHLPYRSMF